MMQRLLVLVLAAATVSAEAARDGTGKRSALRPEPVRELLAEDSSHVKREHGHSHEDAPGAATSQSFFSADNINMYTVMLVPLSIVTLILAWCTRPRTDEQIPANFKSYQWGYLIVWYLAVAADWLQGPYVFALYMALGFPMKQIGQLFVAGFGSSMVFGTFMGSLADKWGRKRCCILYCILYIVSCATKHFPNFWMLMFGRITGGMATSILFSCFESWMVSEHLTRHKFSGKLLGFMFGMMFFGMYCVAIICGLIAQALVDAFPMRDAGFLGAKMGGFLCPFDLAIVLLFVCLVPLMLLWEENYGGSSGSSSGGGLFAAFAALFSTWKIALMGMLVTGFEGSMYAFVFNWTPVLDANKAIPTPHGLVFAMFMMACMCGSSTFSIIGPKLHTIQVILPTLVLGTISMGIVAMSLIYKSDIALKAIFSCFLVFEFCVGLYFPSVGSLKSEMVPENVRATIYNLYRVPLNAVVCGLIMNDMSPGLVFGLCTGLLILATLSAMPMMSTAVTAKVK